MKMQVKVVCSELQQITREQVLETFIADPQTQFLFLKSGDILEFIAMLPSEKRVRLVSVTDSVLDFLCWLANDVSLFELDVMGITPNLNTIEFILNLSEQELETLTFLYGRRCHRTCTWAS